MAKEVKIVTFINDREGRQEGEQDLARMLNEGWVIAGAGGGPGADLMWGFVILVRDTSDE